eukprot:TRINITY_DN32550_c0_g1_i1.p1 TRINITY_DN32550_c0_g1~~TRINITY_DN32550_c0_g1_i1.p1  ORF type:complete len:358 (+),score=60.98 TRINITY_DN32550_c0_g1_i1:58-1074(+)
MASCDTAALLKLNVSSSASSFRTQKTSNGPSSRTCAFKQANCRSIASRGSFFSGSTSREFSHATTAAKDQNVQRRQSFLIRAAEKVRTEQKVPVVLGPYRDGAIKVEAPRPYVAPEDVDKALKAKVDQKFTLQRVNFTGSGAKLGHTVKLRFEGKYAEGPNAGQLIKGTKSDNYELDLKERDDEPWSTFVKQIVKAGMGQEESKSFQLQFPADYKAAALAGIKANFTVTVKEIGVKTAIAEDLRSAGDQRTAVEAQLTASAERVSNDAIDEKIRALLLASSEADVEKIAASVTWAKFGEKSLADFKWNLLQEEIARVEDITFDEVPSFLRKQATITFV